MNDLSIELRAGQTAYHPGQTLTGRLRWWFDHEPAQIELQLLWTTRGKGSVDTQVVNSIVIDNPGERGDREFSFDLPDSPYSFSGKLISLVWSLRAVAKKSKTEAQTTLLISPAMQEIQLTAPA